MWKASKSAVDGTLSQKTGMLRPVGHFSKTLEPHQRKYSAPEKGACALLTATRKWRDIQAS